MDANKSINKPTIASKHEITESLAVHTLYPLILSRAYRFPSVLQSWESESSAGHMACRADPAAPSLTPPLADSAF